MPDRDAAGPITVAVASRDRVWADCLAASLSRRGLLVRELALAGTPRESVLAGVDVLVLDTESLTAQDLSTTASLRRSSSVECSRRASKRIAVSRATPSSWMP